MQSRFTAEGLTEDNQKVLLAYELKEKESKVDLYIVPFKVLDKSLIASITQEWVEGAEVTFPEGTELVNPNLNSETILPDNIRTDETGKIRTKQNDWGYHLLTTKLWESYLLELDDLKKKAEGLSQYDRSLFEEAKSFWERVLEHRKERDISQERLDEIKNDVNSIFDRLKAFRKSETAEFEVASAKIREDVFAKLNDIKSRADGAANYKELIEELKACQSENRKNRFTKHDDAEVRKFFESLFQYIHDQRNHFFQDKTAARIKGLQEVIDRLEASVDRDKKEIEYYERKSNRSSIKSMEMQLIKMKTNMLQDSIASKQEKLKDIYATMEKLQKQSSRNEIKSGKEDNVTPTENSMPENGHNEPITSESESAKIELPSEKQEN